MQRVARPKQQLLEEKMCKVVVRKVNEEDGEQGSSLVFEIFRSAHKTSIGFKNLDFLEWASKTH
jgi:hypothetical protein